MTKAGKKALPVAFNILDKWDCTEDQQAILLGFGDRSEFIKAKSAPESAVLTDETLERMSYIFDIHSSLGTIFELEDSIYGWVNKPNSHPFFKGRSAMEVLLRGKMTDLYDVASRINID